MSETVRSTYVVDPELKTFATDRQKDFIDAVNENGSFRKAAKVLGVGPDVVRMSLRALERRAVAQGFSPSNDLVHVVPSPLVLKGTSTLYDADGVKKLQWVKTCLDGDLYEDALREFVTWLAQDAKGLSRPVQAPVAARKDLLAVYPIGDPHFGMYAWAEEAGENFDTEEAEAVTRAAIDRLVEMAPAAETGLIVELGDMFHTDWQMNRTMRSGNSLDVDSRWSRVMQIGLRSMIYCVDRAKAKHKKVIVRIVRGNHDEHSSFALALALDAYFSNDKRVQIELSPAAHWYYRFGKVLIGATHGDTTKPNDLPGVMACDRAADWGLTTHRYWYHGHIHSKNVKEFPGCMVESFRTLAGKDAWHAGEGYRSGRDMQLIVHHADFGEIERHTCDISMIRAMTLKKGRAA